MNYTKEQLKEDIQAILKSDEFEVDVKTKSVVIMNTLDNTKAVIYGADRYALTDSDTLELVTSNFKRLTTELKDFYNEELGKNVYIESLNSNEENKSLKLKIDGKIYSYDLFDENNTPALTDRRKELLKEEYNISNIIKENVKQEVQEIKQSTKTEKEKIDSYIEIHLERNAIESIIKEIDTKEQERVLKDIRAKKPIEDIIPDKPELIEKFNNVMKQQDTVFNPTTVDFFRHKEFGILAIDSANKYATNIDEDLRQIYQSKIGTDRAMSDFDPIIDTGVLFTESVASFLANTEELGITDFANDLLQEYRQHVLQFADLSNLPVREDFQQYEFENNPITKMLEQNIKPEDMFLKFASDKIDKDLMIIEQKDKSCVIYSSENKSITNVVKYVDNLMNMDNSKIVQNFDKLLKEQNFKQPLEERTITLRDRNTKEELSLNTYAKRTDILGMNPYKETISLTYKENENIAQVFLTKQGNITKTYNTNENKLMRHFGAKLYQIQEQCINKLEKPLLKKNEDIMINYEKDRKDVVTGVILHDVKAKELHYINYATFDKLSVKYDGKRINTEAQKHIGSLVDEKGLQNSIDTLDDVIKVSRLCDGKNAVTVKPVTSKFMKDIAYELLIGNDNAQFQVLVDERNNGKLRYSSNSPIEYIGEISPEKEQFAVVYESDISIAKNEANEDYEWEKAKEEKELKKIKKQAKTKEDV